MEWKISPVPVPYEDAMAVMEARVDAVGRGAAPGLVWLLEHPPLYTAGTSARPEELREARFPVHVTGRGGRYTYHGPGQRVVYVVCNLKDMAQPYDIRAYISSLEQWVLATLEQRGLQGRTYRDRIGVWVGAPGGEDAKIAAIGVRVRRGVAFHGLAINIDPELSHFSGIVPCGLSGYGVTSVSKVLETPLPVDALDKALRDAWPRVFPEWT